LALKNSACWNYLERQVHVGHLYRFAAVTALTLEMCETAIVVTHVTRMALAEGNAGNGGMCLEILGALVLDER